MKLPRILSFLRLFNPTEDTLSSRVCMNGGMVPPEPQSPVERQAAGFALPAEASRKWAKARLVDLEENESEPLVVDSDGSVKLNIGKKRIVTVEFLP